MQSQGKLINQTWENGKNLVSGPNLGPQIFFHGFYLYYILDIAASYHCMQFQRKLMNQTWENRKKPSFEPDFGPFGPNLGHQIFFSKNWLCQSLDIMVSYHHVQYQKKLMIQSWENIVTDGQTDGQTDRLADENDFTGRCSTNVERAK